LTAATLNEGSYEKTVMHEKPETQTGRQGAVGYSSQENAAGMTLTRMRMLSSISWRSLLVSLRTHDVTLNGRPWRRLSLSAMKCSESISFPSREDFLSGTTKPFNGNLNHQFAGLDLD
jgi:hypothetical protein